MKNKFLKRNVLKLLIIVFTFVFFSTNLKSVDAASFTLSASKSSVSPGEKFNISLGGGPIGIFYISVTNGTTSTTTTFHDSGTFDPGVTITAGSSGTVTVTVTASGGGNVATMDGQIVTGSKTVNVKINQPYIPPTTPSTPSTPSAPSKPSEPVVVKSKDNTLKNIELSVGELMPEFKSDVYEYNVLLPVDSKTINVKALVNDDKASVRNTGDHTLEVGENLISLIVTPEEGSEGLYKINVYVEETPKVSLTFDEKKYDVIEHFLGAAIPDSFSEKEIEYEDGKVVGLYSELWETYLLYLSDEDNNRTFYVVDLKDNKIDVVSEFNLISIYDQEFLLLDIPEDERDRTNLVYTDVEIAGQIFKGFKYVDERLSNYSIIYVRNRDGENVYYQYEENNDVYQLYIDNVAISREEYEKTISEYDEKVKYMMYASMALGAVSISLLGIVITMAIKNKRLNH